MGTDLRDYQLQGLAELSDLFSAGHPRATLVLPCGTGKTVLAAHMIATMAATRTVVFTPTVQLLGQTLHRLAADNPDARLLAVCSPVALDADDLPESVVADTLDERVTTDPDAISAAIAAPGRLIIVATYSSAAAVAEATAAADLRWDLIICDEAHRTAGPAGKAWSLPLDDELLPAHHRLSMTATTRIVTVNSEDVPEGLEDDNVAIVSMDSLADYGPHIAPLTVRDAIDAGQLCDYEVAIVAVPHRDILALIRDASLPGTTSTDIAAAAAQLALLHTAHTHPELQSVLAFHNRISHSRTWTQQLRKINDASDLDVELDAFHLDGATNPVYRTRALNALADPDGRLAVVSNCKVFAEGIDVPALDAVIFAAPRTSGPDIVQIVGRALRPHPAGDHKKALIVLPVIDGDDDPADADTKIARTGHLAAWQVLTALAEQDALLHSSLLQWREAVEAGKEPPNTPHLRIDAGLLPQNMAAAFSLSTIARATNPHVLTAAKLREFHATYGHAQPARAYTIDGYPLGERVAAARASYKAGHMHPRVATLFEEIPGWSWTTRRQAKTRTPEDWIDLVAMFVDKTHVTEVHRSAWVIDPANGGRANIGEWIHTKARRKNYLSPEQSGRLQKILA